MLKIKRIYEKPDKSDGMRILVDRLWPRGLTKEGARIDEWMKEIAPSDALRKWFGHKEERWDEFKKRYIEELKKNKLTKELESLSKQRTVTLVYAAKDEKRNNACVLQEFLKREEANSMTDRTQTLDLRPMPPFERHEKIFQIWDTLKSGEALKIINDHDPKPLWYQFEVEYKDKYEWEYEQKGPNDWIVRIKKV